ncbi:bifunctional phosphopantothenoylcysteine decarboxylase/phosphopantothenate--cysteine ligase CoaBC [Neptunicella marina]|uniref:Coenzyme A biosynthesis bifunctional protein CoaBC n=1 Tax=Neptunicella marina TaxID=2125989 RepID=A0A8J6IT75_9ALTE|nr:bifunctional phosphopantothenoylcysteine decarboxylase/phosphopantothenate--cysteine ligase CoaBC [Neptunicella marina]MBC3765889.1 bifunctional phosphopantothenoylcysteine decarboxylase/phosphopantothenate--cysteine ligase CoaBC [Neptunicella marina]
MTTLTNKNVLLGISGGIAAYKCPDLVRKLKAAGANVRVVATKSALEFVSPLSLQAVSGFEVACDLLDPAAEAAMGHIELARWADMLLIAPATANTLAKITHGLADDLLSTICLATDAPVFIAPAMNQQMWKAAITQQNIAELAKRGYQILGPAEGEQACGDVGAGRMLEPVELVEALAEQNQPQILAGKSILITAGPTQEAIDPVRYLSNHSSGKMGYALAIAAQKLGATVTLVSGPTRLNPPAGCEFIGVKSAQQMYDAVMQQVDKHNVFIGCAAVADYRVDEVMSQKIKKDNDKLSLTFVKNPDILASVAALPKPPFTVGFAAETHDLSHYAQDKLKRKKLNMIAANDVSDTSIGFNSDHNALSIFWPGGQQRLAKNNKDMLAYQLLTLMNQHYDNA